MGTENVAKDGEKEQEMHPGEDYAPSQVPRAVGTMLPSPIQGRTVSPCSSRRSLSRTHLPNICCSNYCCYLPPSFEPSVAAASQLHECGKAK